MEKMKLNIQMFANNGTIGILTGNYRTTYTVTWSLTGQSTDRNESYINLVATLYTENSTTISSSYSTFMLDGTTIYNGAYSKTGSGNIFVKTKQITVKHNDDGSFPSTNISFSTNDYIMGNQSSSGIISDVSPIARYPYLSSGEGFSDEGNPTLRFTNPTKNFPLRVKIEAGGDTQLITRDIDKTATKYTFDLTEEERNKLRKLAKSNSLTVTETVCAMDGEIELSASYKNYTMTIINANPIFNDFIFEDINEKTIALTGNNQNIIIGYSNVQVTIPIESKAVAKKEATMNLYRFNNIEANYSDAENVYIISNAVTSGDFIVYAVDSRTNATAKIKSALSVMQYTPLQKGNITANREGGVSENVILNFDGIIDLINFGQITNTIKSAQYRYSIAGKEDWSELKNIIVNVDDNGKITFNSLIKGDTPTLGFNIENAYNIEVYLEDELSKIKYTTNLGSGTPHIAYAKNGIGIMGAYDESVGGLLQVGGKRIDEIYSTQEQVIGNWTDNKPIYRIVKRVTKVSGSNLDIPLGDLKIDTMVNLKARIDSNAGIQYADLPRYENSNNFVKILYYSEYEKAMIISGSEPYCNGVVDVVFEYTKTTD